MGSDLTVALFVGVVGLAVLLTIVRLTLGILATILEYPAQVCAVCLVVLVLWVLF